MLETIKQFLDQGYWESFFEKAVDWIVSTVPSFLLVLILTVIVHIVFRVAVKRLKKFLIKTRQDDPSPKEDERRIETLTGIVRRIGVIAIWVIAVMVLLRQMGVEIGPILAGAGVLGLAVGFGAQNLVRDIISGFFIILEDQVRVGDVAIINGTGGVIEEVNLRTVVLRDLEGTVHIFAHGLINSTSNMTKKWSAVVFDVGVAYKEDTDRVAAVMAEVAEQLKEDENFSEKIIEPMEIFGVDEFGDSAVFIKARMKTKPLQQWVVKREYQRRLKKAFDEKGIEIPFPHMSVYWGEASKSFKVAMEKIQGPTAPSGRG